MYTKQSSYHQVRKDSSLRVIKLNKYKPNTTHKHTHIHTITYHTLTNKQPQINKQTSKHTQTNKHKQTNTNKHTSHMHTQTHKKVTSTMKKMKMV